MNTLIQLSHPAQFHLYKNVAMNLIAKGHNVYLLIKTKDILEDLIKEYGLPYYNILPVAHRKSKWGILLDMFIRDFRMFMFARRHKVDVLTGTPSEVAHVGWLLGKGAINTNEDDAAVIKLFGTIAGPFLQCVLSPRVCNNGDYEKHSIKYESYHELAYLHPNHFTPDEKVVERYFSSEKPYFILRFAKLTAYHDDGISGINTEIATKIIDILKPYGDIYITSERELEPQFEQYRININPLDMHHVMAFAELYIGDSQTMAAEAGVLGVPFVRFNDFVGRIGYLRELEEHYNLGYGVKPDNVERLYEVVQELLEMPDRKEIFRDRQTKMLSEKIDYAKFLTWFIENYPKSKTIMKESPDYQYNFKGEI
ncbi:MAG: DUF354 domain-containing protein [Rikenellaceae bacterium]